MRSVTAVCVGVTLIAGCVRDTPRDPDVVSTLFTDVTEEIGLGGVVHNHGGFGNSWAPEIVGAGGAFFDYDQDGWQDILVATGGAFEGEPPLGAHPALRLFRNLGGGQFEEVTQPAGLALLRAYSLGMTIGDYDNDGDQDIFVTTLEEDLLLRNTGGVFEEIGQAAKVGLISEWSTSAMFFDANRDGFLDLYVGTYVHWTPEDDIYCSFGGNKVYCTPELYEGIASRYYQNNRDGTFTDLTEQAGFLSGVNAGRDKTLGVAELDANQDGWPDVFVANDTERDMLFMNQGDGAFVETGVPSGVAYDQHGKPRAGMGVDIGVVDDSGEPSIFVGNFSDEMVGVYRHIGNGMFNDRAAASRIGQPSLKTLTFGLVLFDVDLDTDLDVLIANGHVQTHIAQIVDGVTFRQRPQLFLNDGAGMFTEMPPSGPLAASFVGRGLATGDYDRDGDLDILIVENNGPAHVWRNESEGGTWLRVKLTGTRSNRNAYGAQIHLWSRGHMQVRRIRSGSSYLSHSESAAFFGLHGVPDSLYVHWPSGLETRVYGLPTDTTIHVLEDEL
ncbi:MAG: CRTAC1 family protein [Rhodothermaceae bacterium]|nr:CRTAC1 family protein [Rhodothermaceae bacterium]MYG68904.1 CRTAC1 family protein [Rhodothermaceae bacterium]